MRPSYPVSLTSLRDIGRAGPTWRVGLDWALPQRRLRGARQKSLLGWHERGAGFWGGDPLGALQRKQYYVGWLIALSPADYKRLVWLQHRVHAEREREESSAAAERTH